MIYKFNHLVGEYDSTGEEREALVYRGTFPVEVWRGGEQVATVDVKIYSDIEYDAFDRRALENLGDFVNQEYQA